MKKTIEFRPAREVVHRLNRPIDKRRQIGIRVEEDTKNLEEATRRAMEALEKYERKK